MEQNNFQPKNNRINVNNATPARKNTAGQANGTPNNRVRNNPNGQPVRPMPQSSARQVPKRAPAQPVAKPDTRLSSVNNMTQAQTRTGNAVGQKSTQKQDKSKVPAQNKQQSTKPRISAEERERLLKEEKARIRLARKARFDYIVSVLILFAVVFAILAALFVGVFFFALTSHKSPDTRNYTLVLSDYEKKTEIPAGSVVADDGTRYVNFSQIADFFGFAMVGSINDMKYVIKESENETVSFVPDSDKAYVNDVLVRTDGPAFYEDGDLYVCESFVTDYILGFDVVTDADSRTVSLARKLLNTVDADGRIVDGKSPEYEDIAFMLKAPAVTASISETDSAVVMPTFEFYSDISAYEEYMNPGSTTEFLTLVNSEKKLSEDYIPTGLALLKYGEGMYLKEYAAKSFEAMMKEASACGISGLTVTRAYVSYDEASKEYDEVVDKYVNLLGNDQAKRYASATVSTPGTDEHQTGLAVDFAINTGAEFSTSTAFAWLCDNSYKFGFVLRYPYDKTDATGHAYKSEQFRYVGRYHAVRMNALGLSLDEYAEYLGL